MIICGFEHAVLYRWQCALSCRKEGYILIIIIIIIIVNNILSLDTELCLLHCDVVSKSLRRPHVQVLDRERFLLLLGVWVRVEPVVGVQGAEVVGAGGLEAGDALAGGERLLLEALDHVGRRLADPGVDVRVLVINGADLVVGEAVLLLVGVVLHWTENISWKLLSFLHNRDYILCEYRETVKLRRPNH